MSNRLPITTEDSMDLIGITLDEGIYVKLRIDPELGGGLHTYVHHLHMILGDVDEAVMMTETDGRHMKRQINPQNRAALCSDRGGGVGDEDGVTLPLRTG